jgi:two-component system chemotaxis response regulator CheY
MTVITGIVIDDDSRTVRIFSELLEELGVKVLGKGYSGKDAVRQYKECNPDIVFLDVTMPEGSGFYAIRKIRQINADSKIIAVTADTRSYIREKLEKLNITSIVYKPFDIKSIMQVINDNPNNKSK